MGQGDGAACARVRSMLFGFRRRELAAASDRQGASRMALVALLLMLPLLASCGGSSDAEARLQAGATPGRNAVAQQTPAGGQGNLATGQVPLNVATTVRWEMDHMTLDEKLGQMFLIETVWQGYNQDVDNMVRGMHAGAMIIYGQNMANPSQLRDYVAAIQAHATLPLLVTMDEEGGVVDRLGYLGFDQPLPAAQDLAASNDPHKARLAGMAAARELTKLGINTDLAPVVDVRTTPDAVEWTRLYGDDPQTVDRYAGEFLQGLQQNQVVGCLKHWPGIGSVTLDPHETLPVITRSKAELESTDFAAFRGLLALHPGMIMVTHVILQAIDPNLPATLSPAVVQGILRDKLGYQGVVMTDSLYMKGISLRYSLGEAAVLSVLAGDDLLEGAWDTGSMTEMLNALRAAIQQGRISLARIDQSVSRILTLKALYGVTLLHDPHEIRGEAEAGSLAGGSWEADLPHGAAVA